MIGRLVHDTGALEIEDGVMRAAVLIQDGRKGRDHPLACAMADLYCTATKTFSIGKEVASGKDNWHQSALRTKLATSNNRSKQVKDSKETTGDRRNGGESAHTPGSRELVEAISMVAHYQQQARDAHKRSFGPLGIYLNPEANCLAAARDYERLARVWQRDVDRLKDFGSAA